MELACEQAPQLDGPRVDALHLRVGPLAGVVTDARPLSFDLTAARLRAMRRALRIASGAVSVASGRYLAHRVGCADGLFLGQAPWTPR